MGQRVLPTDMAVCLWKIVFSMRRSALLDRWLAYLASHPSTGIPGDTWDMYLYLTDQLDGDLSLYDDTHAWPTIFDDFVECENDIMNQNLVKEKDSLIQEYAAWYELVQGAVFGGFVTLWQRQRIKGKWQNNGWSCSILAVFLWPWWQNAWHNGRIHCSAVEDSLRQRKHYVMSHNSKRHKNMSLVLSCQQ